MKTTMFIGIIVSIALSVSHSLIVYNPQLSTIYMILSVLFFIAYEVVSIKGMIKDRDSELIQ